MTLLVTAKKFSFFVTFCRTMLKQPLLHKTVEELLAKDKSLESKFPPKPEEPLPQDCCGCSCEPCVYDMYRDDLESWAKRCMRIAKPDAVEFMEKENVAPKLVDCLEPSEYRKFKIASVTPISHDTNVYRFELPDNAVLNLPAGKHLIVKGITPDEKAVTRQYTPISKIDQVGSFDIMIKIYEFGKMSSYVKTLTVGSEVELRGPFGLFLYKPNEFSHILMVAAGTGLSPMVQVIQKILANDKDETQIRLLYSCKQYDDILLQPRMDEWKRYWNFSACYFLSKQNKEDVKVKHNDEVKFQKIDQNLVQQEYKKFCQDNNYLVLVCGTKSFDKDMINYFLKCGALAKRLFKF